MRIRSDAGKLNRRWLGFEKLEARQMLTVAVDLITESVIDSASPSGSSNAMAITPDGRYVVYSSDAPNIVVSPTVDLSQSNLYRFDRLTNQTVLVSVGINGAEGANGPIYAASISDDGNVIVFESDATNLDVRDVASNRDVFVRDIRTGFTSLVSVNAAGTGSGNRLSLHAAISADGLRVAFISSSTDVHPSDVDSDADLFLRDLNSQSTYLVSAPLDGTGDGLGSVYQFSMSNDGSIIAFVSSQDNIHPLDADYQPDVFVRNVITGALDLASINLEGTGSGSGGSEWVSISGDGTRIAFASKASDLDVMDNDVEEDVFVRDLELNRTKLASTSWHEDGSGDNESKMPVISDNGDVVVFLSSSTNLSVLDSANNADLYALNLTTNITELVSINSAGNGGAGAYSDSNTPYLISEDGRFVVFTTVATGLHELDKDVSPYNGSDVFVRDLLLQSTTLISVNNTEDKDGNGPSSVIAMSNDAGVVLFNSLATDLVSADLNSATDAFVRDVSAGSTGLVATVGLARSKTANGPSATAWNSVSADGRYVVFTSRSTDLVEPFANGAADGPRNVFRFDRLTGQNELVSVNRFGSGGGDYDSVSPRISSDGQVIAFQSDARNLVDKFGSGDANIFVRDMETGVTTLVSEFRGAYSAGTNAIGDISQDGRVVTFLSNATGTHPLKSDSSIDVFAFNLESNELHYVTIAADGALGGNGHSYDGGVNADGSVVVFMSAATNLHRLDADRRTDVYARNLVTGELHLVSVNLTGTGGGNRDSRDMEISDDGTRIAFVSEATNLSPIDLERGPDVYVRNLLDGTTQLVSVNSTGDGGTNSDGNAYIQLSGNGRVVVWGGSRIFARDLETNSTELVSNSSNFDTVISDDGDVIAFSGGAENLNLFQHEPAQQFRGVYARKRSAGVTELISVKANTAEIGDGRSDRPAISGDGRVVAFYSAATDLVENDWNRQDDVFVAEVSWNPRSLAGDYNQDRVVDSADYSVWRDALGTTKLVPYFGADGDGDGTVDQDDYLVWKANFGRVVESGGGAVDTGFRPQGVVENSTAGRASSRTQVQAAGNAEHGAGSGAQVARWRRGFEILEIAEHGFRTRIRPPAEPGAGGVAFASGRQRDLALLTWRNVAVTRWQGSRGELAAGSAAGIHSQDADDADVVFEAVGLGRLSLLTR